MHQATREILRGPLCTRGKSREKQTQIPVQTDRHAYLRPTGPYLKPTWPPQADRGPASLTGPPQTNWALPHTDTQLYLYEVPNPDIDS